MYHNTTLPSKALMSNDDEMEFLLRQGFLEESENPQTPTSSSGSGSQASSLHFVSLGAFHADPFCVAELTEPKGQEGERLTG